ncbi:hypothetical protein EDC04DRAFT_2585670 [Pisolithus marmoratus]|nr:hypothetical protein EDC04DRAFT_2585670 [Pisolithus marmoratus]
MDVEETPYMLLKSQIPALSKALLPQLKVAKTMPMTLQDGFQVLHALLSILPGSLFAQVSPIIVMIKVFMPSLLVLVPVLLKSLGEHHPHIASETFHTFSTLLNVTHPIKSGDWPEQVYDHTI